MIFENFMFKRRKISHTRTKPVHSHIKQKWWRWIWKWAHICNIFIFLRTTTTLRYRDFHLSFPGRDKHTTTDQTKDGFLLPTVWSSPLDWFLVTSLKWFKYGITIKMGILVAVRAFAAATQPLTDVITDFYTQTL